MSETKVPPGWVRLTEREDGAVLALARAVEVVTARQRIGTQVIVAGRQYTVTESPDEVAALIDAAEAAERRANVLPVMAAMLYSAQAPNGDGQWDCVWSSDGAITNARAILDAIAEREGSDG